MSLKVEELDNEKAEKYLLGNMSEAEAFDFECEVFPDENLSEQLEAVRSELSEKFIRSELSPNQRNRFENHFLSFPYNSDIYTFQKSLIEEIGNEQKLRDDTVDIITVPISPPEEKKIIFARLSEILTLKTFAIPAFATLLLFVLGGIILYNSQKNEEVAKTNEPTPLLEKTPETSPSPIFTPLKSDIDNLNQESGNQQNNNLQPEETQKQTIGTPTPQKNIPQSKAPVIAIIALLGNFRDVGSEEKPVIIGKETKQIKLEFQYPEKNSETHPENYKLILETIAGERIWENNLSNNGKSGEKLNQTISANTLKTEQYRFRIVEIDQNKKEETIQSQTFFVRRIS